jgi:uncharacterized protein YbaP (TraB family)
VIDYKHRQGLLVNQRQVDMPDLPIVMPRKKWAARGIGPSSLLHDSKLKEKIVYKNVRLLVAVFLLCSSAAFAQSPVWKVSNGNNYFFIAGSVHTVRKSDLPFPKSFSTAYQQADIVVFENDYLDSQASEKNKRLGNGRTLGSELRPDVYKELKREAEKLKINMSTIEENNPYSAIGSISATKLAIAGYYFQLGVDFTFMIKANKDGKEIRFLEKPAHTLFAMGQESGYGDNYVLNTLKDGFNLDSMPVLLNEWRYGKSTRQDQLMAKFKKEDPLVYRITVTDRNAAWFKQIVQYLETPKKEFVIVGFSHLTDPENGLLKVLKESGYLVEQLP